MKRGIERYQNGAKNETDADAGQGFLETMAMKINKRICVCIYILVNEILIFNSFQCVHSKSLQIIHFC